MFLFTVKVWLMFACMCERACPCSFGWLWNLYCRQGSLKVVHSQNCGSVQHRPFLSHQWPAYCSQSISLYVIIMWFTCIFPLIQLVWMSIMQFRHCLLFNYRTYLSLSNMQRLPLKPLFMVQKFLLSVEIIVIGNWINVTEGVAPYET